MDCAVWCLLFGSRDFFMEILLYNTTLRVQEISQKSTGPKWTQLYHLDNRYYSTIQPLTYPTYIMKIGEWLSLWDFFDTFSQKSIRTAHQNSHQFLKKLNVPHVIRSSSPVTNPSGVLTNIDVT